MTAKSKKRDNVIENKSNEPTMQRRSFLSRLWSVLGFIIGLELFAVIYTYLSGKGKPVSAGKSKRLIEAGVAEGFRNGTVTPFRGGRFFLARLEDGGFLALSLRCTHLGCSVNWDEDNGNFICPCHSSSFDIHGNVLHPPAPTALDYYQVFIENGIVKVDVNRIKKRKRYNKSQAVYV